MSKQSETARAVAERIAAQRSVVPRRELVSQVERALLDAEARVWREAIERVRQSAVRQRAQDYDNECLWAAQLLEEMVEEMTLIARAKERQRTGAVDAGGSDPLSTAANRRESGPSLQGSGSPHSSVRNVSVAGTGEALAGPALPPSASSHADARAEVVERASDPKWHEEDEYRSFAELMADFALSETSALRAELERTKAELAAHLAWGRPQILAEQLAACRAFKDDLERRWRAAQDRLTEAGL